MRLLIIPTYLVLTAVGIALICAPSSGGQAIKATVVSTNLESTALSQWLRELGYHGDQLYPISLAASGCPFVDVDIAGVKLSLMLDTGTARGFLLTNNAPSVSHHVEERSEELNADGSHRGESFRIRVDTMSVLGKVFRNATGSLSDWRMFSSEPFNGTVGLDFFLDRRVTLDYKSRQVAVSSSPLPEKLDEKRYISIDLIRPPAAHANILYVRARVNGRDAIVYLDTGYSVSFIDPSFADGLALVERQQNKFKLFRQRVPVELGGRTFIIDEVREDAIRRGTRFDTPVGLLLGSDVLSHFIITIDFRAKKLVLAVPNYFSASGSAGRHKRHDNFVETMNNRLDASRGSRLLNMLS
jgi:hypothetical protein